MLAVVFTSPLKTTAWEARRMCRQKFSLKRGKIEQERDGKQAANKRNSASPIYATGSVKLNFFSNNFQLGKQIASATVIKEKLNNLHTSKLKTKPTHSLSRLPAKKKKASNSVPLSQQKSIRIFKVIRAVEFKTFLSRKDVLTDASNA